ncbi:uncharacterized protein ora6 [Gouania willdenowi]|uniref:uncharacterized protein ora6 n=1 Tax=Gouania willdenowi TaxID=441366 RepID=UPI0010564A90|nr:uncharacterized protein LOC114457826 [Gouania willdenowi]
MIDYSVHLLALRIFVSCIGLVGNVMLLLFIFGTRLSHIKTYEMFLMGLAVSNLEEIITINVYDLLIHQASYTIDRWSCHFLKFLTVFGENTSILFTVLISIFRYQKLRNATKRVSLTISMDSIRSAWMLSGICVILSVLVSLPIFFIDPQDSSRNMTRNDSSCSPDFFQCSNNDCPFLNRSYKVIFITVCHLLPLVIVTFTGCLILNVLLGQRKMVTPVASVSGSSSFSKTFIDPRIQRSTAAVLAAMGLFQVDWTLYSILQLNFSPIDVPIWAEVEFFISISYTSFSPYVYGVGSNLFTFRNLIKK